MEEKEVEKVKVPAKIEGMYNYNKENEYELTMKVLLDGEDFFKVLKMQNSQQGVRIEISKLQEVNNMGKCPMCGLGDEYQVPDEETSTKSQCKGCGSKYFDKERFGRNE